MRLQTICPTACLWSNRSDLMSLKTDRQIPHLCFFMLRNGKFSPSSAKGNRHQLTNFWTGGLVAASGPTLLTGLKSNIKSPYTRPSLHVALKPWRWRMQDWTLSCQSVLLLTPGVGMVIQQLIEKPSLSQQLLWQFSNKQAKNTHPCTPTISHQNRSEMIFVLFFSYLHVIFVFMSAHKIDIILVLFSDRVTEHLCCVIYINT